MTPHRMLYLLVLLWAVLFVGSILMALNIDGPRNLDTGFKRLDVLVRGQAIALIVAIIAAVTGFLTRDGTQRTKLIGLIPIALTALLIGSVLFYAFVMRDQGPPMDTNPPTPVAPAAPVEG